MAEEAAFTNYVMFDLFERERNHDAATPIEVRFETVREVEECLDLLPRLDSGSVVSDEMMERAAARRRKTTEGGWLPHEPVPSVIKIMVWELLKLSRIGLAKALVDSKRHEEAIPIYKRLVDQTLRMRVETWDEKLSVVPEMMFNLAGCYVSSRKLEEAADWFKKGLHMCRRETPGGSETEEKLKGALDILMATKAGPVVDGSGSGAEEGKAWKKCWTCGALPTSPGIKLLRCSKCAQTKMATPAYYCSTDCQRKDWGRHKRYHRMEKGVRYERTSTLGEWSVDLELLERALPGEPELLQTLKEYQRLIEDAHRSREGGDMRSARRLLEKAIKLIPTNPSAHYSIAVSVYQENGNYKGMLEELAETMRLTAAERPQGEGSSFLWARAAANTAFCFQNLGWATSGGSFPKPDWMQDPDQFLATAERAVRLEPFSESWGMLGQALEGKKMVPRAIECYRKASQLPIPGCNKERYLEHAERLASSI